MSANRKQELPMTACGIVDGQLSSHKKSSHKVVFRKFESIPGVSNGRR